MATQHRSFSLVVSVVLIVLVVSVVGVAGGEAHGDV